MIEALSKKEKGLLILILSAGFLYLSDILIYRPVGGYFTRLEERIELNRKKLLRGKRLIEKENIIVAGYGQYKSNISGKTDPVEDMAVLLNEVEALAKRNGIRLLDIKPEPISRKSREDRLYLSVELEERREGLAQFIYHIQRSGQFLRVENMILEVKDRSGEKIKAVLRISKLILNQE